MVRSEERHSPAYDLTACQQTVARGNYGLSRAAQNYIEDLAEALSAPFSHLDLEKFIAGLTSADFSKSVKYQNSDKWFDVYLASYRILCNNEFDEPNEISIRFYLKFFQKKGKYQIEIVSFHESR